MTTASEDRYLALTARRNRKATARQLSSKLAAATGAVASRQTIYRRLNEKAFMPESQGYVFYCLHRKRGIALIGVKNIKTGLNINGPMFSFTDESRFSLTGDSKRVYIWRGVRNTK
ncbi:transposable element Tcb2 transposase [Trichonephila clavipes]|nr:transposable element Tcb2 transposase [Trichonephila clavipes]